MELIQLIFFGLLGGVVGEALQYWYLLNNNKESNFHPRQALAVVLVAGVSTVVYFSFFESLFMEVEPRGQDIIPTTTGLYIWILIHYGLFAALFIEEYAIGEHPNSGQAYAAGSTNGVSGALLLNGYLQVFGVGCFGAALVESHKLYKAYSSSTRKCNKTITKGYSLVDWIFTVVNVVVGGLITTFHGIYNISALTALQLGASAPLVIKRLIPRA